MRTRLATIGLGTLLVAGPAAADLTLTTTSTGKGMMGRAMEGESVSRIKAGKLRVDSTAGERAMTTIIDLDAQTMTVIDHKRKEAIVTDLREVQAAMQKVAEGVVKLTVTPTDERRQIAGQTCNEYRLEMVMPLSMDPGLPMTITTSGTFCAVPNAPGHADYAGFYIRAAEKGFIVAGDPRQAKAQPGHAKSMTELYRQMAKLGVPYAVEMDFRVGGEGPMAALMGKMGSFGFASTVTRVSTEPIGADVLTVPAGYAIKRN